MRCAETSDCLCHCTNCSLSDNKESLFLSECESLHVNRCLECDMIVDILDYVDQLLHSFNGTDKEAKVFDFNVCRE